MDKDKQFQKEVTWCIEQLRMGMLSKNSTARQGELQLDLIVSKVKSWYASIQCRQQGITRLKKAGVMVML